MPNGSAQKYFNYKITEITEALWLVKKISRLYLRTIKRFVNIMRRVRIKLQIYFFFFFFFFF